MFLQSEEQYKSRSSAMFLISLDHSTGSVFFGKESCCWLLSLNHCSTRLHSLITLNVKSQQKEEGTG